MDKNYYRMMVDDDNRIVGIVYSEDKATLWIKERNYVGKGYKTYGIVFNIPCGKSRDLIRP